MKLLNLDLRHDLHASLLMKMSELLVKYFVVCFLNQKLCHNPHIYCDMYKVIIFFIQEEMKDIAEHISINSDFIFIFVHSMTVWEIKTEW